MYTTNHSGVCMWYVPALAYLWYQVSMVHTDAISIPSLGAAMRSQKTGNLFNFLTFYGWGENLVTFKGRACKLY